MSSSIKTISVAGYKLRTKPTRHFVYYICIEWNDKRTTVYRRYSQFFNLQCNLLESFPLEAGKYDPSRRTLPFLPGSHSPTSDLSTWTVYHCCDSGSHGKCCVLPDSYHVTTQEMVETLKYWFSLFITNNLDVGVKPKLKLLVPNDWKSYYKGKKFIGNFDQKTAEKRQLKLDRYLKGLTKLPRIANSELFLTFCQVRESDLSHLMEQTDRKCVYRKLYTVEQDSDGLTAAKIATIAIIRLLYMKEQSVACAEISGPVTLPQYVAIADYSKAQAGEMSITAGSILSIVEKKMTGWWLAQSVDDNSQGWVPATYLEPIAATGSEESSISLHKYEKFVATCDYKSSQPDELSVHKGALVEVTQKSFDGWWHCRFSGKEGYLPAAYLCKASSLKGKTLLRTGQFGNGNKQMSLSKYAPPRQAVKPARPPRPSRPPQLSRLCYVVIDDFTNSMDDGVSLVRGSKVKVITKDDSGWWYVENPNGDKGWAPSTYLELS